MSASPAKAKTSSTNLSLEEIFGFTTPNAEDPTLKADEEPQVSLITRAQPVVEEDPQLTQLREKRKANVTYSKSTPSKKVDVASRIAIASAKLSATGSFEASPASSKPQSTNSSFAVDLPELEEAKFDEEYDGFDSQEKSASKTANQRSQIDPKLEKTKPVDAASLFNALEKEARDPPASKETKQRVAAATPTMSATPQTKSTKEKPPKQGDLRSFFTKSSSDPSATAAGTTNSDDVSDTAETPRKKQKTKE